MNARPIQDVNDGKPWSEMDLFDPRRGDGSIRQELATGMS
jgi:hypothetical protein